MNEFVVGCMLYNIIICDDNFHELNMIIHITNNYFNQIEDFYCEIHSFNDYDDNFIDYIYNNRFQNLICLLDIETPSGSGFDVARRIKQLDPNSHIIYITGYYEEYTIKALDSCDMEGYINKSGDIKKELTIKFDKITGLLGKKYIFHLKGNKLTYILNVKNINCFTTDGKNQVKIVGNYYPNMYISIKMLYKQLDFRFVKTHQSCIVNLDNVKIIDMKNKIIYFKDGTCTDLIARNFFNKNQKWLLDNYSNKIVFK